MPATEEYWRNLPRMHKVFAGSAILLLGTTLLMMYKDESRSWRTYQIEAERLRLEKIEQGLDEIETSQFEAQKNQIASQIQEYQAEWDNRSADIKEKEAAAEKLQGQYQILAAASKTRNAERDKARADYDLRVRDQADEDVLAEYLRKFDDAALRAREAAVEAKNAELEYKAKLSEIAQDRRDLDQALDEQNKLLAAEQALEEQRDQIEPENWLKQFKRSFKQIPIIEGFKPIYSIKYDWAKGLDQELGMVSVDRVDRCRSCHVNIDDFSVVRQNGQTVGMSGTYSPEEYEQPFCSHPKADLYLTASSPHPVNRFACTICHGGDGSGTSFQTAEHTPSNPAIAEDWAHEYHWHSNHFWEEPMRPQQFIESGCLKCHHDVVELGQNPKFGATAPKVFKGWETIRDYGCFGCHEINGYDGTRPIGPDLRLEPNSPEELAAIEADPNQVAGKMRKVGPSLRYIADKTTAEFLAYWTEEPKRFRPTTRMPQFFDLTNQQDHMADLLQPMEIAGISTYLIAKSEEFAKLSPAEGYQADAQRGAKLFAERGCLACHSKQGEEFAGANSNFGPDLSRIHEKIKPGQDGFLWLYTWIKEPSLYHTRTKMPDLFLDPYQEPETSTIVDPAADIAAFLLQGEPGSFPALPSPETNLGLIVTELTEDKAGELRLSDEQFRGILITGIVIGSPADRAELQLKDESWQLDPIRANDVLVDVNGTAIRSIDDFAHLQSGLASGESVTLTLVRDRREIKTRVLAATPLDDLVRLYLSKSLSQADVDQAFSQRRFPVTADMYVEGKSLAEFFKGDEVELAPASFEEEVTEDDWQHRKMVYVGRRTISRYGCYGCHDIPGFETARPIGAALNDWGRKDTSKLAFEHIHEYLHHHGEIHAATPADAHSLEDPAADDHGHDEHEHNALGTSTAERMELIVTNAQRGQDVPESDLTEAMLYKSAITHGRAGFLWQKLRQPRSYDYMKTETKNWDERLRMPKFPFQPDQIEAVSTFVLGLVASPPAEEFLYHPDEAEDAIFEGERLLAQFNCTSCHVLEMDTFEFSINPSFISSKAIDEATLTQSSPAAFDLLKHIKPFKSAATGETVTNAAGDEEAIYRAKGFLQGIPDPDEEDPEFRIFSIRFWDGFLAEEGKYVLPGEAVPVNETQMRGKIAGRGGDFGKWLVDRLAPTLSQTPGGNDFNAAWQASVPTLIGEGHKVQTPWLYQFLKNPEPLRRSVVLRMPRFNMSDTEAQTLANYFAAIDGVPFPYQLVRQNQLGYQAERAREYAQEYPNAEDTDYLTASWYVLNGPLCRKCHNVGGNVVNDPKQVKGPNLQRVQDRLRPEWTQLWVYKPMWIYPYTSMPENFPSDKPAEMKKLFAGENPRQAEAVIDALFNYSQLMEIHGETTYNVEPAPGESAPGQPATTGGAE